VWYIYSFLRLNFDLFYQNYLVVPPSVNTHGEKRKESFSVVIKVSRGEARPVIADFSLTTTREPVWMSFNVTAVGHVNMFNLKHLRRDTKFVNRVCRSGNKTTDDTTVACESRVKESR
jgi:hypothetical protein